MPDTPIPFRTARIPGPGTPSPPVPPAAISGRRQFKKRAAALTPPPIGCRPHRPSVSRPLIRHSREMPRPLALPFRQTCARVPLRLVVEPATRAERAPIGCERFPGHSACYGTERRLLSGRGGDKLCVDWLPGWARSALIGWRGVRTLVTAALGDPDGAGGAGAALPSRPLSAP